LREREWRCEPCRDEQRSCAHAPDGAWLPPQRSHHRINRINQGRGSTPVFATART
jgi:hypothetical protein